MVSTPGPPMYLLVYASLLRIYATEYKLDW